MVKEPPRVELIIVALNTPEIIAHSITGHVNVRYPNYHLTVIDNASTDDTWQTIKNIKYVFPSRIKSLQNDWNEGYAAACNIGAKLWRDEADYYVFMNSDIFPIQNEKGEFQDWITPLVETFEKEEYAGVVAPKLLSQENNVMGHAVLGTNAQEDTAWYWQQPDGPRYNKQLKGTYLSGACIMVPKELFWEAGGFVELEDKTYLDFTTGYFHYKEEKDLIFTLRKEGYEAICNPESTVTHLHKGTIDDNVVLSAYSVYSDAYFNEKWVDYLKDETVFTEGGVQQK